MKQWTLEYVTTVMKGIRESEFLEPYIIDTSTLFITIKEVMLDLICHGINCMDSAMMDAALQVFNLMLSPLKK